MACPTWRWVCSAAWINSPVRVVGRALRPMLTGRSSGWRTMASRRWRVFSRLSSNSLKMDSRVPSPSFSLASAANCSGAQRSAFRIGAKAIQAAGDVAQLKCDRGQVEGAGVEFAVVQTTAPPGCVFLGHLERMEQGSLHYRHIGKRASQPRFCYLLCHRRDFSLPKQKALEGFYVQPEALSRDGDDGYG